MPLEKQLKIFYVVYGTMHKELVPKRKQYGQYHKKATSVKGEQEV